MKQASQELDIEIAYGPCGRAALFLRPAVEKSFLLASEFQPAQAPAPGEDPPAELQLSFFELPGFMQTPQRGGS